MSGSVALDDALASPGFFIVPRSYTYFQSVDSAGVPGLVVFGPEMVSATSRPPTMRCRASVGSITNGVENMAEVRNGLMSVHVFPPSVVTLMSPPVYSS